MAKFKIIEFPKVDISLIVPSETPPQQHRRKHYNQSNLNELAKSIAENGVLDPLKVRLVNNQLHLVDGERRYRASQIAGLKEVPYALHEYTDKQVLLIQVHSNLHRENPHPLDEAYNYGFMRDGELKMSPEQIAAEVGKEVAHIEKRLKLLTLPEIIREAYERGEISLNYAQEIARYPVEDHEEIFSYCFSNYGHTSQALYPFPKAKAQIDQHYLLQLSKAPFPLDDPNLRSDGRTCLNCHLRTGAQPLLMNESGIEEKDSCFDRECYNSKVEALVQIKRVSIATNVLSFPQEKAEKALVREVPVVATRKSEVITNVPTINIDDVLVVESLDACPYVKVGIGGDGEKIGKEIYYCNKPDVCRVHRPLTPHAEAPSAEDVSAKMYQKEEAFQILIGEAVRREVLRKAAHKLNGKNIHLQFERAYTLGLSRYADDLIEKLWSVASAEETDVIHFALDSRTLRTTTENLTSAQKCETLFLLIYAGKGRMSKAYKSQQAIKDLAREFELDYQMIDAVKRLELAPEQYRKVFYDYLRNIEDEKRDVQIPQVYSQEWERKD